MVPLASVLMSWNYKKMNLACFPVNTLLLEALLGESCIWGSASKGTKTNIQVMASVMQTLSFNMEINPVCFCQASQWNYWQAELTKCHWPALQHRGCCIMPANAPIICPADVTIYEPKFFKKGKEKLPCSL